MALASPDEYDTLALLELEAASAATDAADKKRRLNQASAFATLAELAREMGMRPTGAEGGLILAQPDTVES